MTQISFNKTKNALETPILLSYPDCNVFYFTSGRF